MPELVARPILEDFQHYVRELEAERGFSEQDVVQKCLMLGEEVGELFKVVRKHTRIKTDPNSSVGEAGEEDPLYQPLQSPSSSQTSQLPHDTGVLQPLH